MKKKSDIKEKELINLVRHHIKSDQSKSKFAIEVYKLYKGVYPNFDQMIEELGFSRATAYRNIKNEN
jgi:hypothetical protein